MRPIVSLLLVALFFAAPLAEAQTDTPGNSTVAATPAAPASSTEAQVWVNTKTHVYHKEGSRWYGKTKAGKYMSEADAIKEGDKAAKN